MTAPDHTLENMNWADYFDALANEKYSWPIIERRRARASARVPERRTQPRNVKRKKEHEPGAA
jgi:hypothetical protein